MAHDSNTADAVLAEAAEKAVGLRHALHGNAELSGTETRTKRMLMDFISENTSLELCDMGSWFYAAYRTGKDPGPGCRRIAFRADMDALPIDEGNELPYASCNRGVSHKCGHDGHSASLAAFALAVDRLGCDNDVFFLFQHSEENGEGAAECARLIDIEAIDEIYGFHNMPGFPRGAVMVHDGVAACASKGLVLRFKGKNSHASQPENGVPAAYALAELISALDGFVKAAAGESRAPSDEPAVRGVAFGEKGMVMCTVVGADVGSREQGGGEAAFGTSAGFARLMLTVRAEDEANMDALEGLILTSARALAAREGLGFDMEYRDPFPETRNTASCAEKVRMAAESCGFVIAPWNEPFRSSEDFGYYTKKTNGALFYIGCGEAHAPLHTPDYDFEDALILTAAKMFLALAR